MPLRTLVIPPRSTIWSAPWVRRRFWSVGWMPASSQASCTSLGVYCLFMGLSPFNCRCRLSCPQGRGGGEAPPSSEASLSCPRRHAYYLKICIFCQANNRSFFLRRCVFFDSLFGMAHFFYFLMGVVLSFLVFQKLPIDDWYMLACVGLAVLVGVLADRRNVR